MTKEEIEKVLDYLKDGFIVVTKEDPRRGGVVYTVMEGNKIYYCVNRKPKLDDLHLTASSLGKHSLLAALKKETFDAVYAREEFELLNSFGA